MRILITGGAGFVGSSLALRLKHDLDGAGICALDNLRRRGSELALPRLRSAGVDFIHGDVRNPNDIDSAGAFDVMIECSAEPSVHAGYDGSPSYVVDTNLAGALNCLEAARRQHADVVFLSTSRVYPIQRLRALPLERAGDRLEIPAEACGHGWSRRGVTADFPLAGHRSLYGATKLAAELMCEEYRAMYGLRIVINRCGVIAGPWQMGKVDQGFVALWAARHAFGGELSYTGFGGDGLQVRDVLHVSDLCALIRGQLADLPRYDGAVFNVGGGHERSVSLLELTGMCAQRAGRTIPFSRVAETAAADVPYYVTDNSAVTAATGWTPARSLNDLVNDVFAWLREHRTTVEPVLGRVS